MNVISLIGIETKKIHRSGILWILLISAVILWLPSIFHAHLNFEMQAEGISPEHNFLIQGFLGMAWFMYPASMVVGTVLLNQTERSNNGILKMLALPLNTGTLCLAKFMVLLFLAAAQILMTTGMYFISAAIVTRTQNYAFLLSPLFVFREAALIYLASIPMLALFWMLSVCIRTPIFSVGIGLASIVPSVLMINTRVWFLYPMSYPFYCITSEYGKLASKLEDFDVALLPWLPVAAIVTLICMTVSCLRFGRMKS